MSEKELANLDRLAPVTYEEYLNKAAEVSKQVINEISIRRIYERLRNRHYCYGNKKSSWLMALCRKKVIYNSGDTYEINYYLSTDPRKRELLVIILQKLNNSTLFNSIFHDFEIIKRIKIDNEGDRLLKDACSDFINSSHFELYSIARDLDFVAKLNNIILVQ